MTHTQRQPNDTVTVDPSVLLTIARLAALNVEGVARLGYASGTLDRLLGLGPSEDGIHLTFNEEDDGMIIDIFVVVDDWRHLQETSRKVQEEINRTMQQYAGMEIQAVNVHIEDVIIHDEQPIED
jgi:uncharacterized alkaline shock family protein YloU